jgi:hypothetical protein
MLLLRIVLGASLLASLQLSAREVCLTRNHQPEDTSQTGDSANYCEPSKFGAFALRQRAR